MRKIALTAAIIITFTLFASILGTVNAQTYTAGVKDGDTFKYQYEVSANTSSSSQVTVPSPLDALVEQAKTIDWIQMRITAITGSTVTAEMTTKYKSGGQQSYMGTVDLSTGQGTLSLFLIAANLTSGNPLYSGSKDKINGTTTRNYASGNRELNYQNLVSDYTIQPGELTRYNITVQVKQVNTQEAYWDKTTGALAQLSYGMVSTSSQVNATLTLNLKLIESNVFTVPEYPAILVVMLVLIVPAFVLVKYRKKIVK